MRRRFIKTTSSKLSQFDINNYITIEALEDNLTISVGIGGRAYYGIDGIGWNEYETLSEILLNKGQTVSFKGTNVKARFYIDKPCNILGNGYSLLAGDNAVNITDISVFGNAILSFSGCQIINVASSFLPATTLTRYCYSGMFSGCTSLVNAPALPATTLANGCYESMFRGCTSLVNAPALPATTLARYCYEDMFYDCEKLVNAPELPATTLVEHCYYFMFRGCTSLVNAPALPATTLASFCYSGMFSGCTSLVNAPALPATTLAENCYNSMFVSCTNLKTAPVLPATALWIGCYSRMFEGCSKLNYIKALFAATPSSTFTSGWVKGVASSGTFVKNKKAIWNVTGEDGVPSGWTIQKV